MMFKLIENKKGIEAGGFSVVIGIILLLLSAGVIIWVLKSSAGKADEKTQIEMCRVSNEIRVGTEEYSHWYMPVHSPTLCNTIYNLEVPTEKYSQDIGGAVEEIGDMLKNCWYAWLEGSRSEVFPKTGPFYWSGGMGCHVCYVFKVKDKILEGETLRMEDYLQTSLKNRIYFAADSSNQCAPDIGGFLESSCENFHVRQDESDEWKEVPSKDADADPRGRKCCISEDVPNECENKGGMCSETGPYGVYTKYYSKWSCPKGKQKCYVRDEDIYTYHKYLTQYGARGGEIKYPETISGRSEYNPDFMKGVSAVSIYSGKGSIGDVWLTVSSLKFATDNSRYPCKII